MVLYNVFGFILTVYLIELSSGDAKIAKIGPNGPVQSQDVVAEDKTPNKDSELFDLIKNQVNDDVGKAVPQKIVPGGIPLHKPPSPDRNWGRMMNEEQWRQRHARLNPKAHEVNKKVMHNRNAINDNRHDRKGMKIPRHVD